jgi:hypothetical protein
MPFSEGEAVLIAEIDWDKIVRGVCVGCGQPPTDTPCIHSANKQDNELKQQLR